GRAASTNDIGEFRVFELPPGAYFLSAVSGVEMITIGESRERMGYAPTYYPGTADIHAARRLSVGAGDTISDVTISLTTIRTARVTGNLIGLDGQPLSGFVFAQPLTDSPLARSLSAAASRPDGSFTLSGLAPGDYRLDVVGP